MLINTQNNAALHATNSAREAQQEKMQSWVEDQTANSMFVSDPETSAANDLLRIGQALHSNEIEKRLKRLNPSLHFEFNTFQSTKKMMYLVDRRGKTTLFPYEYGITPERSIMNVKVEMVPIKEIYNNNNFRLQRKDMGKKVWSDEKQDFISDTPNPYMEKVLIPWSERVRGWRTILIKLVLSEVITPTQAELAFGSHGSKEWQNSLGKAKHILPW